MSRHHHPAGNGRVTAAASRPSGSAEVLEAHRQAGRAFRAGGVGSFVREQGSGELWMTSLTGPAFRFLMRLQGIGDPAAVSRGRTRHLPRADQGTRPGTRLLAGHAQHRAHAG